MFCRTALYALATSDSILGFLSKRLLVGKDNSTTTQTSNQRIEIRTDVDLREGQNIIVGNATLADADVCLFLVVSGKLAQ